MTDKSGLIYDVPQWIEEPLRKFLVDNSELNEIRDSGVGINDIRPLRSFFFDVYCAFGQRKATARTCSHLGAEWADVILSEAELHQDFYEVQALCQGHRVYAANAAAEFCKAIAGSLGLVNPPANIRIAPDLCRAYNEGLAHTAFSSTQNLFIGADRNFPDWASFAQSPQMTGDPLGQMVKEALLVALGATSAVDKGFNATGHDMSDSDLSFGQGLEMLNEMRRALEESPELLQIISLSESMGGQLVNSEKAGKGTSPKFSLGNAIVKAVPLMRLLPDILFESKAAESSLVIADSEGSEEDQKGPIVILIDCSGSMDGPRDRWAKALTLCCIGRAQQGNRPYAMCLYNNAIRKTYHSQSCSFSQALDCLTYKPDGGTEWAKPVEWAIEQVTGNYVDADVILITDASGMSINETWVKQIVDPARKGGMKLRSILIGSGSGSAVSELGKISDSVQVASEMGDLDKEILAIVQDL